MKISWKAFKKIDNWGDFFLDYLGLKKGHIIYKIGTNKIKLRAGTIDKSILTEIALTDKYFPKKLKLREKSTIIDLGAHIGIFSILIGSKFPNAKIYAIEPLKKNFELLIEQTKINKTNIKPIKIAITNKKGQAKLYCGRHSARGSLYRKEGNNYESVETTTLKNFFKKENIKKCDLLKIDIEGGEYPTLYSTPKKIFKKIERILLEIHPIEGEDKNALIKFLKEKGFKIFLKEKNFIFAINNNLK